MTNSKRYYQGCDLEHNHLQLQEYIVELSDTLFDLTLIEANSDLEVSEVSINILGNGIIYFLSSIFSYDLLYFYEALYHYNHFVSKAGDFFDITYNEARLLLKLHHERIEKENEESKRQSQQNSWLLASCHKYNCE